MALQTARAMNTHGDGLLDTGDVYLLGRGKRIALWLINDYSWRKTP